MEAKEALEILQIIEESISMLEDLDYVPDEASGDETAQIQSLPKEPDTFR